LLPIPPSLAAQPHVPLVPHVPLAVPADPLHRILGTDTNSNPSVPTHTWYYYDLGRWKSLDATIGRGIEQAYHDHMNSVGYFTNGYHYKLNFSTMRQTNLTTGMEREVKRILLDADPHAPVSFPKPSTIADSSRVMTLVNMFSASHPTYWTPTDIGDAVEGKIVPCQTSDSEFALVQQMIRASGTNRSLVRVSKIVHPMQYFRYTHWCDLLRLKKPNVALNEAYAFHGTPESSVISIVKNGFKYRFNGRHMYGRGSYFAVRADYSLDPMFSTPNPAGEQFLLIARVCVGNTTLGTPDLLPSSDDSYQTAVDSLQSPTMYVTFHDDQTYPEFLAVLK
jgi:poly [ADP-ribose] polymerase 10/14/15